MRYDHNEDDLKDILSTVGVSRDEVANTRKTTIRATSDMYMMSRFGQLMASDKEISMSYQKVPVVWMLGFSVNLLSLMARTNHSRAGWDNLQKPRLVWHTSIQR